MVEAAPPRACRVDERTDVNMILDKGICTLYKVSNSAAAGAMPVQSLTKIADHWFADLEFEAAMFMDTDNSEQILVEKKIRILQNLNVLKGTVIKIDSDYYKVVRVYHGKDELIFYGRSQGSGELISDISLTRVVGKYD